MTNDEKLKVMMKKGWNILIECKSSNRQIPLTYEVDATNVPAGLPMISVVGDDLDTCITDLHDKVSELERMTAS